MFRKVMKSLFAMLCGAVAVCTVISVRTPVHAVQQIEGTTIDLYSMWKPKKVSYRMEVYIRDVGVTGTDDDDFGLTPRFDWTVNNAEYADSVVTIAPPVVTGCSVVKGETHKGCTTDADGNITLTINADGSTVYRFCYTRDTYSITVKSGLPFYSGTTAYINGTGSSSLSDNAAGRSKVSPIVILRSNDNSAAELSRESGAAGSTVTVDDVEYGQRFQLTGSTADGYSISNKNADNAVTSIWTNGDTGLTALTATPNVTTVSWGVTADSELTATDTGWGVDRSGGKKGVTTTRTYTDSSQENGGGTGVADPAPTCYMPAGDVSVTIHPTPKKVSYTVKRRQEDLADAGYTMTSNTTTRTALADSTQSVSPTADFTTYTGFTAPAAKSLTVSGAGGDVVTFDYTRNSYTVTLSGDGHVNVSQAVVSGQGRTTGTNTYKYGSKVTITAAATGSTSGTDSSSKSGTSGVRYFDSADATSATSSTRISGNNYNGSALGRASLTPDSASDYYAKFNYSYTYYRPWTASYVFSKWSDNGAASHTITVGAANASYSATTSVGAHSYTSGADYSNGFTYSVNTGTRTYAKPIKHTCSGNTSSGGSCYTQTHTHSSSCYHSHSNSYKKDCYHRVLSCNKISDENYRIHISKTDCSRSECDHNVNEYYNYTYPIEEGGLYRPHKVNACGKTTSTLTCTIDPYTKTCGHNNGDIIDYNW